MRDSVRIEAYSLGVAILVNRWIAITEINAPFEEDAWHAGGSPQSSVCEKKIGFVREVGRGLAIPLNSALQLIVRFKWSPSMQSQTEEWSPLPLWACGMSVWPGPRTLLARRYRTLAHAKAGDRFRCCYKPGVGLQPRMPPR